MMKIQERMRPTASGLRAGSLSVAVLLSGQTIAQQVPESQVPQAPKAPTIESLGSGEATTSRGNALQAPRLAGNLELNLQHADGQDGDGALQRDTSEAEVQLTLEYEQRLGLTSKLEARLELGSRRYSEDLLNNDDDEFSYDLERFYFQWDPSPELRIRAGRFNLDDPMETIVDEDLDGIRVTYEQGRIEMELSRTRKDWFEASSRERLDKVTNTMGAIQFSSSKNSFWKPYVLHRSAEQFDNMPTADVTWFGIQSIIRPNRSATRYWLHGSVQDGEELDAGETAELGGYLLDIGFNWTASGPMKPTFTIGVAHATGGSRADRFRQSGLHSNDFALNRKNSFRYLGEVMDPELTNIQVVTLGAGFDLTRIWSADVVLHHYTQVEIEDQLRASDIEFDPLGENDDLGYGADVIVGYDPDRPYDIKGTAGLFEPGDAFANGTDVAWLARIEISYDF